MPIFWLICSTAGSGRLAMSSPLSILSIETAASWPCATAQMIFLGPNAASPPKNTFGLVETNVTVSTFGMFHSSNSMPQSRSIQGKAFSWPTATRTSSQGKCTSGSPALTSLRRPLASYSAFTFSKVMPVSLPLSWVNCVGTRKLWIGMPSCWASSFSQGEAFISSKPERTTTLTSSPPSRRAAEVDAEAEDVAGLLVDHAVGQPEFRDLRADHAAGFFVAVEYRHLIAERGEVARHGERGGAGADQRDALAVLARCGLGQPRGDVVLEIGGHALEPADRHRLVLDAHAPAGRLARTVAGAPENSRKHVRFPIDHVGVGIAARRDQPDIFRNGCVGWTGPLAIDHLVEIVRRSDVGIL